MSAPETVQRPAPGELVWRSPDCPLCMEETESDGESFACRRCGCYWGSRAFDEGNWDDEEQCRMVLTHGEVPVLSGRCVLSEGHVCAHNNDKTCWDANRLAMRPALTEGEATP